MLGKRADQRGIFEADQLFVQLVPADSFHGRLAALQGQLFRDEDFAEFYCADNGRTSKPPSLMATALVLQAHDKVSDAEASARAAYDLRWKVALGVDAYSRPFAQSTLQCFRAQLILHEKMREVFVRSLELARERGLLQGRSLRAVLDTTPILGLHKGIFWAGIGGCVRIGGPAPCVAGPGAARATVSGVVRSERRRGGGQCRCGGPRGAEDRGGRGVERAMEECDAGAAPRARVGSGAAGVHRAQARAEVGARRRPQPHAGPQTPAQQQAAQQRHALLQEAVAARGQRRQLGRVHTQRVPGGEPAQAAGLPVAGLRVLAARTVGHGQQGGNSQH